LYIRLSTPVFLVLLAVAIGSVVFGLQQYRFRFVRAEADILKLLPQGKTATFFADFGVIRHANLAAIVQASGPRSEEEYRRFVSETGFDYSRDIDAVAGSVSPGQIVFAVKGRFQWDRLAAYARQHGGRCQERYCDARTSRSGRWASWREIQPNVMLLAVSDDRGSVMSVTPGTPVQRPGPVWVRLEKNAFEKTDDWSPILRLFTSSLKSAEATTFSIRASGDSLALDMNALFRTDRQAEFVRNQLALETKMLKLELTRENREPTPHDFTGLLVAGSFQASGCEVFGTWPIRRELLEDLGRSY
jgi:hypothetical protein